MKFKNYKVENDGIWISREDIQKLYDCYLNTQEDAARNLKPNDLVSYGYLRQYSALYHFMRDVLTMIDGTEPVYPKRIRKKTDKHEEIMVELSEKLSKFDVNILKNKI